MLGVLSGLGKIAVGRLEQGILIAVPELAAQGAVAVLFGIFLLKSAFHPVLVLSIAHECSV
jgi:hypothetical protein